jgi:hypothetical protein
MDPSPIVLAVSSWSLRSFPRIDCFPAFRVIHFFQKVVAADLPYAFVRLEDLKACIFSLWDGHLLIAVCRLIHALGRG